MLEEALRRLGEEHVDWRYKGFPAAESPPRISDIARQRWSLLEGDLLLPIAVLRESALAHNLDLMAEYCEQHGVSLAPHGKTTMSPQLFARQLRAGAWGMTAATASQVRTYRAFGVERIILANELVEHSALRWLAAEVARDPAFDFYCLVDSLAGVELMERALADDSRRPLQVLVELGLSAGRTGCRSLEDAAEVADAVGRSAALELAGVEAFEGIVHEATLASTLERVDALLAELDTLLRRLVLADAFADREEVILTVGGSAFFDRVVESVPRDVGIPVRTVLRGGCYLTHDSGLYRELSPLGDRAESAGRLHHALEVWGAVLSRPEPHLALVSFGKRDVSYDIDLPIPLLAHDRMGLRSVRDSMEVFELNDQHAYVRVAPDDPLAPGDLLGCGISHPCTTFDKWRLIPLVDDEYRVIDAVRTFF